MAEHKGDSDVVVIGIAPLRSSKFSLLLLEDKVSPVPGPQESNEEASSNTLANADNNGLHSALGAASLILSEEARPEGTTTGPEDVEDSEDKSEGSSALHDGLLQIFQHIYLLSFKL